jgi:hypothetical protein
MVRTVDISHRASGILSIADRLNAMNRALTKKLRSGPLGRVRLVDLIKDLTAGLPHWEGSPSAFPIVVNKRSRERCVAHEHTESCVPAALAVRTF